jgi:hypothetical protein
MEKLIIEDEIKNILNKILTEETSKVSRYEFSRVQFKIEETENSLNETIKEFRKLQDSIPTGLKKITSNRLGEISSHLNESKKTIVEMKEKIRKYKKSLYNQPLDEKKK